MRNPGKTPPAGSSAQGYHDNQNSPDDRIFNGRWGGNLGLNTDAPPIVLYHPAFSQFVQDANNLSLDETPDDIVRDAAELMQFLAVIDITSEPEHRTPSLRTRLGSILGVTFRDVRNADGTAADGTALVSNAARCKSCCPAFIISIAGPWITISGGVFTDKIVVQRLSHLVWCSTASTFESEHVYRVARLFYALRMAISNLAKWYLKIFDLEPCKEDDPKHVRYFPFITSYRSGNVDEVFFRYEEPLEDDARCVVFLVRRLRGNAVDTKEDDLVVLAPQLFHCEPLFKDAFDHLPRIYMVVMEYIQAPPLNVVELYDAAAVVMKEQVRTALKLLHEKGIVYGDMRSQNIMVYGDGQVKVIDFDWAGKEGEVRYPPHLNKSLKWVDGVVSCGLIKKEHDIGMWEQLCTPM
ncbi:hypothetical protein FISHEDRAFT_77093 [Fistulina hepatica ATCC 64428]|uniref:Protein kinase domain-containing protein n=1 Tax=Fistulina hepatica ATCC 64428 TaxID=1128425 RepID=A0A0D7A246_9AGAR|nr:hypothetical protein FISHEDRAFT_77093 [Fistulina hepatica ATCC 64428]